MENHDAVCRIPPESCPDWDDVGMGDVDDEDRYAEEEEEEEEEDDDDDDDDENGKEGFTRSSSVVHILP